MTIKDIADRLEAWGRLSAWDVDRHEMFNSILADLRALDGKTVLPRAVERALLESPLPLTIQQGTFNGVTYYLASRRGIAQRGSTPATAIDALAEELRKGKT